MNTLVHADIFFFVTTICVALITLALLVVLVYVIKVVREARDFLGKIRREGEHIIEDVEELRHEVRERRRGMRRVMKFISRITDW